MLFLAIDIGNTRLKWALYAAPEPHAELMASGAVYLEMIESLAEKAWKDLPHPAHVLVCNVAGDAIRRRLEEQLELWDVSPSWVVASSAEADVRNGYDHPARLGADRWVALIGARWRIKQLALSTGRSVRPGLVVMVGTAVTVDALDDQGQFLGGFILPGHGMMLRALESGTAGLHVPTGEVRDFPTNTSDALTSGGTHAIAGAIERMYQKIEQRCSMPPVFFMTGGAAPKMAASIEVPFEVVDSLIFEGLLCLAQIRIKS